jgi:hypothetical protein
MLTILGVYQLSTSAERYQGGLWYPNALEMAHRLAGEFNIHPHTVVGVISALSPRNQWDRNLNDAANTLKLFKAGGESAALTGKVCTFNSGKVKAVKLLADNVTDHSRIRDILKGPKLVEFYNCITASLPDVCIDGHAYSVWLGDRVTLANVPKIGPKLRAQIKADYKRAADHLQMDPSAIQAVTWLTWRRMYLG